MAPDLDNRPRATHYGPPANRVLQKAGLLDKVREHGIEVGGAQWMKPNGTVLAKIENSRLKDNPDRISCLPLNHLCELILEDLEKEPLVTLRWNHRVDKIHQDDSQARVIVNTSEGIKELAADYVVYYDFEKHGWADSNFIIHPENYFMAAKIQSDGMWRVSYGEIPGLSLEEYQQRQPAKYRAMLPGSPESDEYRITSFSPYKVHQRLAPKMRVGRFILAGDAAHLCNPFGGMGLTGGLVDAGDLFDCLAGIHDGRADPDILDKYDHLRREKYNQLTNPISESNLKRMSSDPDEVEAHDAGLAAMREADKTDESSIAFQLVSDLNSIPVLVTRFANSHFRKGCASASP
ncbi:hypothetical protein FDECE_12347 [Fusarium decemcellulare]|nr:hypothetical protein FDECE_12347 [Fusarium decemcellulare]